jgi:S-DNA-T family DNA segregation ATPase FtsK/SpoIIIE
VPARIAFTVVSQVDSRTIIDQVGAEKLLGRGDSLYSIPEFPKPKRVQGALISDSETQKVCDFLRGQRPPNYNEEVISQPVQLNGKGGVVASMDNNDMDDDMWKDAVQVVIDNGKASTSLLQRKLRIGYGRASRMMDMMEEQGIIGQADGAKPREVLVRNLDEVFGEPAPAGVAQSGGEVYDDMPDEE